MRMLLHDGVRLEFDVGQHHLLGRGRADVNARKDGVSGTLFGSGEVFAHDTAALLWSGAMSLKVANDKPFLTHNSRGLWQAGLLPNAGSVNEPWRWKQEPEA